MLPHKALIVTTDLELGAIHKSLDICRVLAFPSPRQRILCVLDSLLLELLARCVLRQQVKREEAAQTRERGSMMPDAISIVIVGRVQHAADLVLGFPRGGKGAVADCFGRDARTPDGHADCSARAPCRSQANSAGECAIELCPQLMDELDRHITQAAPHSRHGPCSIDGAVLEDEPSENPTDISQADISSHRPGFAS